MTHMGRSTILTFLFDDVYILDFLLSNNHINSIIVHKFDFSDEEVSNIKHQDPCF